MKEKRDWPSTFAAFESSGVTQREFCRLHGIVLASFKHQLYLRRKASGPAGFSRIALSLPAPAPATVELHLPGGLFLRFAGDVGAGYLRELITALRP